MAGSGGQASPSPSSTVRVTINGGGTIVGKHQPASADYPKALDLFYGIPYGEAPRRFRPAVAVAPPGPGRTLRADEEGPTQPFPMAPRGAASERELRLTIVRPAGASPSPPSSTGTSQQAEGAEEETPRLPVIVYVHGGAFNFGHPLERDLAAFVAWAPRDVLVVGIEYRLGALGFLSAGHGEEAETRLGPGNLGLWDQRLALAWVGAWAAAFGGRVHDVTLMGVSAGAHSVGHHMLSPTPAPLPIRKAILESGSPTARSVLAAAHPRPLAQLASLRALARGRPLSRLPLAELLDAAVLVWAEDAASACWPFQPVVDGAGGFIPEAPARLWRRLLAPDEGEEGGGGKASPRRRPPAVITGFCSHEGTQFVPQHAATNADFLAFFRTLIPALSAADLAALEALYPDPASSPQLRNPPAWPPRRFGAQYRRLHEAYAHYAYIAPVLHTAHTLARAGARVHLYEYAAVASTGAAGDHVAAAAHGDHAPVVAHDMAHLAGRPGLEAVARAVNARWAAFAAHPEGELDPDSWPAFVSPFDDDGGEHRGSNVGRLLVFGRGNDEAAGGSDPGVPVQTRTLTRREMDQCRFWWDRMELSQGRGVRPVQ
ncbi:carboxylesterase family protein [Hirsutella rhossiliensis]|uniref:Carboxylic ester hydrolase n=1 Tax=Hirsutella rhossiliensis TaxID=111463 RepID=A0A9P8SKI2_9HYPO|nr:carboxylesterase family domain-containing protein [Hirsutella rhossiliensis]KAH0966408.1 carboxylesterase family domain-containing protein [Hirsutella rhossiliensis]